DGAMTSANLIPAVENLRSTYTLRRGAGAIYGHFPGHPRKIAVFDACNIPVMVDLRHLKGRDVFEEDPFVALRDAEGLEERSIRVGQELDRQRELGAEVLVGRDVVGADAGDVNLALLELGLGRREGLALDGAARRVVFRVDVDHEPLAGVAREGLGLSVLILEREVRESLSGLEHRGVPPDR